MDQILTYGIGVSHHNGAINWDKVKAFKNPVISYVYIKTTESTSIMDAMAMNHATGAARVGLKFGYYHFARPSGPDVVASATAEARYFMKNIDRLPKASAIPVLDIEANDKRLTPAQIQVYIETFIRVMKENGYAEVMIYGDPSFFNNNLPANHPFASVPLWIANWTSSLIPSLPRGFKNWRNWQYSAKGRVDGINGDVDLSKTLNMGALLKTGGIGAAIVIGIILFF